MFFKPSTIASVILTLLAAGISLGGAPQPSGMSEPIIIIEARYPGANATDIAENVAAPIEQQVKGVENALHLKSRCMNDGKYILAVTFKPGTDLDKALVLVQNRVALAELTLPDEVKRQGVTTWKHAPVRMLISLTSPDGRRDLVYLSNYASIHLKDELARVAGVSGIVDLGHSDYSLRIWLDPDKLAARNLTPAEVVETIQKQNRRVAAGRIGQPPVPPGKDFEVFKPMGKFTEPKDFEDIVVKTDGKGVVIRVKDIARVELAAAASDSFASLNSKPAVLLGVTSTATVRPSELSKAIAERIAMLGARLPDGLKLDVAFDFTANLESPKTAEYLLIDVTLPDAASVERVRDTLKSCEKLLSDVPGVQDRLALSVNPFEIIPNEACILIRLAPPGKRKESREDIIRAIRAKLEKIPATLRVRDLSRIGAFPRGAYPLEMAVSGPDASIVTKLAQTLASRLNASNNLMDAWANRDGMSIPSLLMDIDRAAAAAEGVSVADIYDTLQVHFGSVYVNEFNRFGRTWQVVVQTDGNAHTHAEDLKKLKVRNTKEEMIPLSKFASMRSVSTPRAVHYLDSRPMAAITANPAAKVTLVQAREICNKEFQRVREELRLPNEYRLTWLQATDAEK